MAKSLVAMEFDKTSEDAITPSRATVGSVGLDLYSAEEGELFPGQRRLFDTGIRVALPDSCMGKVEARSGMAMKSGVIVGASVIDTDFRGSIKVLLFNLGNDIVSVSKGDRIAQLVVIPVVYPVLIQSSKLGSTERNEGGFGSTGKN